jgi:surfactin synthase thioesterase subunit
VSFESPTVVVFPGAGSFGGEFQPLLRELGRSAWLARYPGRFGKDFGTAAGSFGEVVLLCTTQVRRRQPVRPMLVGHSFGAYVAYATAARLEQQGTEVSALVVVGATGPARLAVPESARRTRSDTAAYLEAIDPGLVSGQSSGDWQDIVIDTAWHDLRLLSGFRAADYGPLHCPVFAVRGETDPLTSDAGAAAWAGATRGAFSRHVFAGGHSDLLRSLEFASWLRDAAVTSV